MLKKALCFALLSFAASAPAEEYPPQPYSFSYDSTDEFGTRLTREESSDANNFKTGSYGYTDANGVSRTVKYTADASGFHVTIETNEPGTKSSNPADAVFTSSAVEDAPALKPLEVKISVPKPVVVQAAPATISLHETAVPVQAAPVTVPAAPATIASQETPVVVQAAPVTVQAAPATGTVHETPVEDTPVAVPAGPVAQPALSVVAVHPALSTAAKSS
ncbi:uncharacterized protein LOC144170013 [Haemaphysalis longicornis]